MAHQSNNEKEQHKVQWPDFIQRGIEMLYGEYQPDQEVKEFIARWGGLDKETLVRALSEGQGEDRLLAICIIGESDLSQARILLLPFLHSPEAKERWFSALYLGRRKEKLALPVLITMLTEFLPSEESPSLVTDPAWFDQLRGRAVDTLLLWKEASLASVFRQAFLASVNGERYLPEHPVRRRILLRDWYSYQDGLSYALGRKGAFGALTGIPLSPRHQRIAIVKMAIGYKQVEAHLIAGELEYGWEQEGELRTSVKAVLAQRFGLSEGEQEYYLDTYKRDLDAREKGSTSDEPQARTPSL